MIALDPAREAAREDLPALVPLLERAFPSERPWLAELEWQYLANPRGPALMVNARNEAGAIVAHYALVPSAPLDDPRFEALPTWFSLNTVVRPDAGTPGLMVSTARALFRALEARGPALVLGVANENSFEGFRRLLGFHALGALDLRFYPPGALPEAEPPRALRMDGALLRWRAARPNVETFADAPRGALLRRLLHRGLPLDGVLTSGLAPDVLAPLGLPARAHAFPAVAPRLVASFGPAHRAGFECPDWLRPSPLEYIVRAVGRGVDLASVIAFLGSRRFEFLDFDVV